MADGNDKALNPNNVQDLVEQLVHKINTQPSPQLTRLVMRILASRIQPNTTDFFHVIQKIQKKLQARKPSASTEQSDVLKFQALQGRLLQHSIITQKGPLLTLLLSLMDLERDQSPRPSLQIPTPIANPPKEQAFDLPVFDKENKKPATVATVNGSPTLLTKLASHTVSEQVLLKEVLYAFQGINSDHIYYDRHTNSYVVSKDIELSSPVRDLLGKLCELGWLYTQVSNYLKKNGTEPSFGLIGQSFCYALQTELADYYRLIAILEAQVDQDATAQSADDNQPDRLTLRRLVVWVQDPFDRIRFLAQLIDSVDGLRGGALASGVFAHSKHGDPFVRRLVEKIMKEIASPIFMMIRRWVFEGELDDPEHEFFVVANENVTTDKLWHHKYSLDFQMVPTFISSQLAQKILVIGKSINFIRHCFNDTEWVMDSVAAAVANAEKLGFSDLVKLDGVISQASEVTNRYLTTQLLDKYHFLEHCRALKQYLLLGQGDFIQYLMDLLGPELSKRATQIYRHNLMNVLETALNCSNAKYESPEVLNALDVKLLQPSAGDDGWDVFAIHYKLPPPIDSVISEAAMSEYLQIFHFLWRLKRVEYSLSTCWSRDMNLTHAIQTTLPQLRTTLHKIYLLRCEMVHFISNLHNYMMFEVLETSWHTLKEEVGQGVDLDDLIASHEKYLANIKQKALMQEDSIPLLQQLRVMFDLVIKFCKLQEILYKAAMDKVAEYKMLQTSISRREKDGEWARSADLDAVEAQRNAPNGGINEQFINQIQDLGADYHQAFQQLLALLRTEAAGSENLRFLTFRLNFNEYYDQQRSSTQ